MPSTLTPSPFGSAFLETVPPSEYGCAMGEYCPTPDPILEIIPICGSIVKCKCGNGCDIAPTFDHQLVIWLE